MVRAYFDSAFIVRSYVEDELTPPVRAAMAGIDLLHSSEFCLAEVASAIHRNYREDAISAKQAAASLQEFERHVEEGFWQLLPLNRVVLESVLNSYATLSRTVYLRAADAIHLATARAAGFREIWSNDKHMLAAAKHFGLKGRSG